jgi:hypothetical protein
MLRRWLILVHRYLGIALCLLFLMWFVSGIAMIYARDMPRLDAATRLRHLPPLDLSQVHVTLEQAAQHADLSAATGEVSLLTILGRPAYRFAGRRPAIVFADTGDRFQSGGDDQSLEIASRFLNLPASAMHHEAVLQTPDQWTIGQRRQLPLHKIAVDDAARTELYVSNRSGEVVVQTTRGTRALAWIAAIPHWLYFTSLRLNDPLWRQVVLWTSGLGIVSSFIGLVLIATQYRVRYTGLMRWHYVTGSIFGVFALTWVVSGFLSMEPWYWASGSEAAADIPPGLSGNAPDFSAFPPIDESALNRAVPAATVKQVDFRALQDEPYYVLRRDEGRPLVMSARTLQLQTDGFAAGSVIQRVREFEPAMPIARSDVLSEYDAYYYERDGQAPLPALRIKFSDPDSTWIYVDLTMSDMVARFTRRERIQRWIYHGLHSLDFPFWYNKRPLWDIVVIALCSGGTLLSALGIVLAFRRLKRAF